jgi:hypothetical protein
VSPRPVLALVANVLCHLAHDSHVTVVFRHEAGAFELTQVQRHLKAGEGATVDQGRSQRVTEVTVVTEPGPQGGPEGARDEPQRGSKGALPEGPHIPPWPLHSTFIPSISQHKFRVYSKFNFLYSEFN